ncbi:hypothetical protein GCM10012285_21840 [Streptomyces kronopolitis]|uniref:Uncharacterized protein n=1 Tax=Streptomyces kronopolitis TaxID=1612435 RepID=A0ABQ2JBH7_9ACTN|nr:hypothetical protein GCM10012285_21840 [Streptomyces kronopolitis]
MQEMNQAHQMHTAHQMQKGAPEAMRAPPTTGCTANNGPHRPQRARRQQRTHRIRRTDQTSRKHNKAAAISETPTPGLTHQPPHAIPPQAPHTESRAYLPPREIPRTISPQPRNPAAPPPSHHKSPASSLGKGRRGFRIKLYRLRRRKTPGEPGAAAPAWRTQAVCGAVVHRSGSGERGRWVPVGRVLQMLLVEEAQAWSAR